MEIELVADTNQLVPGESIPSGDRVFPPVPASWYEASLVPNQVEIDLVTVRGDRYQQVGTR